MYKLTTLFIVIVIIGILGYYSHSPHDHIVIPDNVGADVKFYNYSGHKLGKTTSKLIIMLEDNLGACNIVGDVKATTNGEIGICTSTGWKIHQSDE